jgi:hypothetical protein
MAGIKENYRKFLPYLSSSLNYWKKPTARQNFLVEAPLSYYPLSFKNRIEQGHYHSFDNNGVPLESTPNGDLAHHYTTISSYSFGLWELYLLYGKDEHRNQLLKNADYILSSGREFQDTMLFLDYDDSSETNGAPCAMNQGEVISTLCRAYLLSENQTYLQTALIAAKAFRIEDSVGGIMTRINGNTWFLEGGKIILNGHIYAAYGLHELYLISKEEWVIDAFNSAYNALIDQLKHFDNGFWSWYWLNEPKYIASAMYHNLHILQLRFINEIRPNEQLLEMASRFQSYAQNPIFRIKALRKMVKSKLKI